jgi:adenylate cyclase
MARINYQPDKALEQADESLSLLRLAQLNGIPHASACGGHARCSTCRVMVLEGLENLSPRTEPEVRLATAKGFEPNVRLACQTCAHGPATVRRLVLDDCDVELVLKCSGHTAGKEATLAILFSDIRSFTPFAEHNLAYDVVHVLNRYFFDTGSAVLQHGGYIDKYIGDGLMALFGLDSDDPANASRQAVRAALEMLGGLPAFNSYLTQYFGATLEIGIGIHTGSVILGEIGHPKRMQLTAIGDAVNVASRVESATKEVGARLLVTAEVAAHLGDEFRPGRRQRVHLKGTTGERELIEILATTQHAANNASGVSPG